MLTSIAKTGIENEIRAAETQLNQMERRETSFVAGAAVSLVEGITFLAIETDQSVLQALPETAKAVLAAAGFLGFMVSLGGLLRLYDKEEAQAMRIASMHLMMRQ